MNPRNAMAASATLHCLTGCAIGEVLGLMIGTAAGLSDGVTIALAVGLAFLFGYLLSTLPLLQAGLGFFAALSLVFAADTLSIATMEVTDNLVMWLIPGAMEAGLVEPIFWIGMMIALTRGLRRGLPGQPLPDRQGQGPRADHAAPPRPPARPPLSREVPMNTNTLAAGLVGFLLGGLTVSIAAELEDEPEPTPPPSHGAPLR